MTLLICVFAAVIATVKWYVDGNRLNLSLLCFMYWGASIMWLVDALFEYAELKAAYFTPSMQDILNDSFLGLSVVALGLVIWTAALLIKDPLGHIRRVLTEKQA